MPAPQSQGCKVSKADDQPSIRCPIGLFAEQERQISRLTLAINRAETATDKAPWAQELIQAVDVLRACEAHDESSSHCHLCRDLAELRCKTAALVIQASKLAR